MNIKHFERHNMKIYALLFSILTVCFFNACTVSRNSQNTAETPSNNAATPDQTGDAGKITDSATPSSNDEIKKVDFKNFTYEPFCGGDEPEKITVKKGEYSRDKGDDKLYFNVENPTYGDVNGDGKEDAIILSICNTGGTGQFSEGFVYEMKDGKPALLTRIEGGDRADGGLVSAKVQNGLLAVERNLEEGGGACCPEATETINYKWNSKKLVEQGKGVRRELYPPQRVSFQKGAASTNLSVKIPAGELKRFVVGAGAGQNLIVTSDNKNTDITMVKGDAGDNSAEGGLNVMLNKNGDYVFQIQNTSDKDIQTNIKIEIH